MTQADPLWFRWHRRVPAPTARLVCFPHAGGAASFFRNWPGALPPGVEVLAVRYPGREDRIREPFIEAMAPMADAISKATATLVGPPLAFFGHSLGASVAHEVAVRLERDLGPVLRMLFVSARPAPHRLSRNDLHIRGDAALIDDIRRLDRHTAHVFDDPELRTMLLPMVRADYRLVETYYPDHIDRVDVPIVGYNADTDPEVSVDDVAAWRDVTRGRFELRTWSGDHFFLTPQERAVVEDVGRRLLAAVPGQSGAAVARR